MLSRMWSNSNFCALQIEILIGTLFGKLQYLLKQNACVTNDSAILLLNMYPGVMYIH